MMDKGFAKQLVELVLPAVLLVTVGCAGLGSPVTASSQEQGKMAIDMKANSFEFQPNNIKVPKPVALTLTIENISGTAHNITIKNPEGQVLKSADLPSEKTISVTVDLLATGKYEFYCDKPLHATLGMKGQIQEGP
jgi:plastocyanin